jgi:hypothetical protein
VKPPRPSAGTRPAPLPVTARGDRPSRCAAPPPTTVAGYQTLFAGIPVEQWAAGDGAVTVPFGGTSIWLFGDTFSARPHGFVHSSAIVQTGGCLHVSHGGAQLLPDDPDTRASVSGHPAAIHHIYWIEGGHPIDATHLAVTARSMSLVPHWDPAKHEQVYGTWDFADGGFDRTALIAVSATDDLTFVRWTGKVATPPPDPGPMLDCEAPAAPKRGHFCYSVHTHPELRLTGGHVLVSTSQGWDDRRLHPFADYRPIFSES